MDGDDLYLSTKAIQISYNPCLLLMHEKKIDGFDHWYVSLSKVKL